MTRGNKEFGAKGHIAVFLATSGHSGVDRVMKNLLPALAARGFRVDLLRVRGHGPNLQPSEENLRIVDLGSAHAYSSIGPLVRYLKREQPDVLLSDKDRVNRVAILGRVISGTSTRSVVRTGTTVSMDLKGRKPLNRLSTFLSMRYLYRLADRIILPSSGAVEDFLAVTGLPADLVRAVPSPVRTPELLDRAAQPPEHPWLSRKDVPVVLGIGELSWRKDFGTLIRAFSMIRRDRPSKLIIYGEGRHRQSLQSLIEELGLTYDIHLPGFTSNPYSALANADLYVHSSRFEGSPVALMEAVSLGTPSVSTDCPSGPREILGGGIYGHLVSVGDAVAMGEAMARTMDNPPDRDHIKKASKPFTLEGSTEAYLRALGFE